jgi:dihydropteroate synthase
MLDAGADIVDVGGESTRPGSEPVDAETELARVLPVIERLSERTNAAISVDTTKSRVAAAALAAGAAMVNDVSAMTRDPRMAEIVAANGAAICLMHMRGTPATMQALTDYEDVVTEVRSWLSDRVRAAEAAGIPRERIVVDPGFGFAKTVDQNLELVRRLSEIASLGCPVLLGPSRKSTIGAVLGGLPVHQRLEGTAAVVALAIANGAAIVRVHDVLEMTRVARMTDAIVRTT